MHAVCESRTGARAISNPGGLTPSAANERPGYRPTWAEISKSAFIDNLHHLKKSVNKYVSIMAVLKADAYGHGAAKLAPVALRSGADSIGVATIEEGLELRQSGITAPILLFSVIYPNAGLDVAIDAHLTPTIANLESARALGEAARRRRRRLSFQLKFDTGMGRLGFPWEEAAQVFRRIQGEKDLHLEAVYTHLACADSDKKFTEEQLRRFGEVRREAEAAGLRQIVFHAANSAATLGHKDSHQDAIRPGLALYGAATHRSALAALKPVLSWHTAVIFLKKVPSGTSISYDRTFVTKKPSLIATLPVGYADGVPRRASNRGFVLVRGVRRPVVGRVTMDHIMVDVTGLRLSLGEPVKLIGNDQKASITALDWAEWADTSPYEIFCGISKRVPRVFIE